MTENDRPDENDREGIKVVDRRKFTADGELRQERRDAEETETSAEGIEDAAEAAPPPAEDVAAAQGFEHRPLEEPPGVDFTMLINAMAQPALYYLGELPSPDGTPPRIDLEQAKLQIDMLELLKVKSRGNLEKEEDALLDQVLYQLRMLFVGRSGGTGPAPR